MAVDVNVNKYTLSPLNWAVKSEMKLSVYNDIIESFRLLGWKDFAIRSVSEKFPQYVYVSHFLPHDASEVYAVVVLCVSICVRLSHSGIVSKRLNVGSRKQCRTIAPGLVFWRQRSRRNSNWVTPYGGVKCKWGGLKSATFDEKRAITRKLHKIDV